jgi:hypothetical protein
MADFHMGRHAVELAGLGTLAAPSVAHLRGKDWSEKNKSRAEVAGLGMLAAPYVKDMGSALAKRFIKRASAGRPSSTSIARAVADAPELFRLMAETLR